MILIKTSLEFKELIDQDKVIVEFSADWSTPSKMLEMIIEEIEEEQQGEITFLKVDTDRFRTIAKEYNVVNVPVIKIFSQGKEKKEKQGLMRKEELLDFIEN